MLRNSGSTPMPSGSMRISSSSPPGRNVGLMHPTTPRQLVNAMQVSSWCRAYQRRAWRSQSPHEHSGLACKLTSLDGSLVAPDCLHARRQREPVHALSPIADRAGQHVVDQDRAGLVAFAVGREGPHNSSHAADRSHLDDHAELDDTFEVEQRKFELEAVDGLA